MDIVRNAEVALRIMAQSEIVVLDTETTGLDWKVNNPVGWVIGDGAGECVYVPIRHGGGGNLYDPDHDHTPETPKTPAVIHPFERELARILDAGGPKLIVGHHVKFDAHMALNVGVSFGRRLSCTQNNQALIDEYTRGYGLEALAERYKVPAKRGQELYDRLATLFNIPATRSSMSEFWRTAGDDPVVVDYSAGDGVSTLALYREQMKEIEKQELHAVKELEDSLIWTLVRMERRGIRVNTGYLEEAMEVCRQKEEEALSALPEGLNVRSPVQVREYLEFYRNDWPTTELGNPSFKEDWLKTFPQGQLIVAVRKWRHVMSSYIEPLATKHTHEGRVHAQANQNRADNAGTIAGRLSYSDPNLQGVPKHDKEVARIFREAFVADPGMVLSEADWSQCEPRLFAHYSGEPALVKGYSEEPYRDVHSVVAELFKADRGTTAKRMNMGMFTGMFPKAFAEHMGLSLPEAKALWERWFAEFPAIRGFQNKAKTRILARGYVKTLLGRRGRLEKPQFAYRATSKIIQGGNADIIKYKLVEIDKALEERGDEAHLLLSIHDAILWQAPEDKHQEYRDLVTAAMLDVQSPPFNLKVPFAVDVGSGRSWAVASLGEA